MKRIGKSLFLLLLSFTMIGAFSVTPILAHDTGDDFEDDFSEDSAEHPCERMRGNIAKL